MSKKTWKSGNFIYPIPAVMVSCGTFEKSNIITVAWTGTINTEPAMLYISIKKERYSHKLIHSQKEFVLNLTTKELARATDWCGVRTGAKVDKFKETHLTKEKADFVKCPMIKESPVSIECKVVEEKNLGSHTMFLAKVLAIHVDEQYFDKKGTFNIQKCNLIAYANGGYYELRKKGSESSGIQYRKRKDRHNILLFINSN
jgi:flavin reductase (DIM6/NTAB) family NADH-FMN oxidoreductase RutF